MWTEKKKHEEDPKYERNSAIILGKIDNIIHAKRAIEEILESKTKKNKESMTLLAADG